MLTVLELFAGIGGCAEALRAGPLLPWAGGAVHVRAIDISTVALDVYRVNFEHAAQVRTLESLPDADWAGIDADLWWLSPPCQPYTRQGRQRDLADPRAAAFAAVLRQLPVRRPRFLAMENVPGFVDSDSHAALRDVLTRSGYVYRELLLCPTELGWPMRRRRFYLVASRSGALRDEPASDPPRREIRARETRARETRAREAPARTLWSILRTAREATVDARWHPPFVEDGLLARYRDQLHVLDPDDPHAVARCFTSAYGRSPVRSGSYLRDDDGSLRHLTPDEILGLMGFRPGFRWPSSVSCRQAWALAGNSLSIPAVCHVLACLPGDAWE